MQSKDVIKIVLILRNEQEYYSLRDHTKKESFKTNILKNYKQFEKGNILNRSRIN